MKDLTLPTMIAVFEEVFGSWLFWCLVAGAIVGMILYLYVLIRDRSLSLRKFLWAQISMPFGATAAVWLVLKVTSSRLADLGGPIDFIVLLGIAAVGAIGISIVVYTLQSIIRPAR
ncbi:MAG: DUF5368 domain-containing protein [Burkholderiaceae bacterium]